MGTMDRDDCIRSLSSLIGDGLLKTNEEAEAIKMKKKLESDDYTDIKIVYE